MCIISSETFPSVSVFSAHVHTQSRSSCSLRPWNSPTSLNFLHRSSPSTNGMSTTSLTTIKSLIVNLIMISGCCLQCDKHATLFTSPRCFLFTQKADCLLPVQGKLHSGLRCSSVYAPRQHSFRFSSPYLLKFVY